MSDKNQTDDIAILLARLAVLEAENAELKARLVNCPFCGRPTTYASDIHCVHCDRWFDDDTYAEHDVWKPKPGDTPETGQP